MKNIIENCLNGNITVYEYFIYALQGLKLDNNTTLFSDKPLQIESNVDYSKMTDREIDDYDNKLYLSIPHNRIKIKTVKISEIIDKIKDCHTILFILINDIYENNGFKLFKKSINDIEVIINTTSNLNLFDTSNFIILTWTDFKECGYI